MSSLLRLMLLVVSLLFPSAAAWAQSIHDPFGHWMTTLSLPIGEMTIEIDLAADSGGRPMGQFSQPRQQLAGLPLTNVKVDGTSVRFDIPGGLEASFSGRIDADGQSIAGEFSTIQGSLPVTFTRSGDAHIVTAPVSAPITTSLEGTWRGILRTPTRDMHVMMVLTNRTDGTSAGSFTSLDEGRLTIPLAIAQHAADVRLDSPVTHASYTGTLNAGGTEIAGTYAQLGVSIPLTFTRETSPSAGGR
jgi:hypothetical protein